VHCGQSSTGAENSYGGPNAALTFAELSNGTDRDEVLNRRSKNFALTALVCRPGSPLRPTLAGMLRVKQVGFLAPDYDVFSNDESLTLYETSMWRAGGTFTLDAVVYEARCNLMASWWDLTTGDKLVARAGSLLRAQWTIQADGHSYRFQRAGLFRREFEYLRDDAVVGFIRRPSMWNNDIEADLPGLPLVLQVFLVGVCVVAWRPKG
jgi:hypothetical protein